MQVEIASPVDIAPEKRRLPVVNILCIKWGTRYGPHYVNELLRGMRRHLRRPFLFHCCTDDSTGLDAQVRVIPFPSNPGLKRAWPHVLVKLLVTQDGFGGLSGPTLFLDLDVVVMDSIDCLFDFRPGKNCIIHNWVSRSKELIGHRPPVGNSSVFRFEAGKSNYIYETFIREMARAEDLRVFKSEQAFLTHAMREVHWWPEEWTRSYKRHCRPVFPFNLIFPPKPPRDCRILVFHGRPDPDEAIHGYRGKRIHHHIAPAPWIAEHWQP
jgi:hypothetical protein